MAIYLFTGLITFVLPTHYLICQNARNIGGKLVSVKVLVNDITETDQNYQPEHNFKVK